MLIEEPPLYVIDNQLTEATLVSLQCHPLLMERRTGQYSEWHELAHPE